MGEWSEREVMYVAYAGDFWWSALILVILNSGELFLRMLKALILPLVVPSLITAVGSLDMSLSGKVREAPTYYQYFIIKLTDSTRLVDEL